jgi:ribosome modulation factor
MTRRKKQTDIEDAIVEHRAEEARLNSELTDDEARALLLQHKRHYQEALATKKAADAAFKNVCKKAKAECGDDAVADIKDAIALSELGGQLALEAEVARKHRIARWMGLPIGAAPLLFDVVDRRPAVDVAYDRGKAAGMAGETAQPPHDPSVPQYQRWLEGWHDGQEILSSAFRKLEPLDVPSESKNSAETSDPPFVSPDERVRGGAEAAV